MVTQVQNSSLASAGTANDVLRKTPGVVDDGDGLKVLGRGTPEVYINGRKVRDASELDQLASGNIRNVEVVTNPGARYDASVKAVIRIQTKKAQGEGFGFNSRTKAEYTKKAGWLEQFNFNYRKGKFDLFGLLFYSDSYYWKAHQAVQDTYLDKHWTQESRTDANSRTHSLTGSLGMNYVLDDNHSLGVTYRTTKRPYARDYMTVGTDVVRDDMPYESSVNDSRGSSENMRHALDFYYRGKVGGWSVDFDGNAIWQSAEAETKVEEQTADAAKEVSRRTVTTASDTDYRFYAAKMTWTRPVWGGSLVLGAEYGHINRTMDYRNNEGILEDNLDKIRVNNASAFAEFSRQLGKVNAQVGIRYEYDDFNYYVNRERRSDQSKVYHNLFPSATLLLPVGSTRFMLQYRSEIRRSFYSQLSSQVSYINQYTYEGGNPLLRPVLTHSVGLGVSWRWLTGQLGYQHVKDDIFNTSEPYSDDEPIIALVSQKNAQAYDMLFASATASPSIGIWSPAWTVSINKQWMELEAPGGTVRLDNPLVMLNWENSLNLPGDFQLSVGVRWMSTGEMQNTRLMDDTWMMNASLYKAILKGRLSFLLQADDIFDTQKQNGMLYSGKVRTIRMFNAPNSRCVSLTVRYKLNAAKIKYKGTGAGDSQKSRM
ncbi:outer membrane beta-barrel protein [uncultured Bacteroides sp.]|uniref:outer membrane beta-barrel protein n=3 Tax=uncultured Bacteroides sp. TaxID=162156 RepID=UPI00259188D5|nr:outer membrane beta-barrel protein [uncultured Bacteroides sp.]